MKCERLILALLVGFTMYGAQADDLPTTGTSTASEPATAGWFSAGPNAKSAKPPRSSSNDRTEKASANQSDAPPAADPAQPAQQLLLQAMSLIGVKYKWGGKTPESGLDCSGFVRYVFQNSLNITLPHNALAMSQAGQDVDKSELKPGDLVFFNTLRRRFSHVGIYLGDNRFVHAPRTGRDIEVANMSQSYWTSRFDGARRVTEVGGEAPNIASLLALAGSSRESNKAESAAASGSSDAADSQQGAGSCRKVTKGKGRHKRVETICSKPKTSKAKAGGKTSTKAPAKAGAKKSAAAHTTKKKAAH